MNEILEKFWKDTKKRVTQKPYSWGTITAICSLIIIPIIIWVFFLIGDNGFVLINTSLEVGDALGFYSSVVASIATLILGVIAVMQNNRLQKLETDVANRNNSCSIYIKRHDGYRDGIAQELSNESENSYDKTKSYFNMTIENYSEAFLKKVTIQLGADVFCSHITLVKDMPKNVQIFLPKTFDLNTARTCKITFTSCYDIETYGEFELAVGNGMKIPEIHHYRFYGTNNVKN